MELSEVAYFKEPGITNTARLLAQARKQVEALEVKHAVIAGTTGHTVKEFLKVFKGLEINTNVATMEKGSVMPVKFLYTKYAHSRAMREDFIKKGMEYFPISLQEEILAELKAQNVKVFHVPDPLGIGPTMGPDDEKRRIKTKLDAFLPKHLRPLDIEAGTDLSLLNIISKGFRVAIGIAAVATGHGLVPKGEKLLTIAGTGWAGGGADTAIIVKAHESPIKCYVKAIIGFPIEK